MLETSQRTAYMIYFILNLLLFYDAVYTHSTTSSVTAEVTASLQHHPYLLSACKIRIVEGPFIPLPANQFRGPAGPNLLRDPTAVFLRDQKHNLLT